MKVYSAFISSLAGTARHDDAFRRLTVALGQVQHWIATHEADELACLIAPFFVEVPVIVLSSAIRRYYKAHIWSQRPELSRA